jgi:hypothetical protein
MPRIRHLEIRGFRAFGSQPQALDFGGPMAVVWGPNSQGKTSIAEAIEFLLTGKTVRRELLASAKREFAEALRNAHLPAEEQVVISAQIEDASGQVPLVERRLVRDYTGRDPCETELTIDGVRSADLTSLGIRLSQPPLEAPVLMPHTLRYVVSAEPQQRAEYFKALLEVSDLEEVRTAISNAKTQLVPPPSAIEILYQQCRQNSQFGPTVRRLETGSPSKLDVADALNDALGIILSGSEPLPNPLEDRLALANQLLTARRGTTFPINAFDIGAEPNWTKPEDSAWQTLERFIQVKSSVDKEVSRLARLFEEVLKVPGVADATDPVECPVCKTPKALTPQRIEAIRKDLQTTAEFRQAQQAAENEISNLRELTRRISREGVETCPHFFAWDNAEQSRRGFSRQTIDSLLGDQAASLISPWSNATVALQEALRDLRSRASDLERDLGSTRVDDLDINKIAELRQRMSTLFQYAWQFLDARRRYQEPSGPLVSAVREEVDRRSGTEGWQNLIDVVNRREELFRWLCEKAAYNKIHLELDEAVRQIDDAKARVLDEKFSELGNEVLRWWNLLRPDELTSFDGIQRGGTGRRYIDLKARLASEAGGSSNSVLRDAVAVFSDSQLNCLGLAAFLARTLREGSGFVVLDDPVPASDDEHRAFFIDMVLGELVNASVQVIVLTHDERTWKGIQERYKHLALDTFIVNLENPVGGAMVENRSDNLDALLARATPFVANPHPDIRKIGAQRLRDAAERFCKLALVHNRQTNGDTTAKIADYDRKTLGELVPDVEPLLTKDPSHPGKVRTIRQRLNPGVHDDDVPPGGDLKQCLGDLRYLRKEYLS